MRHKFWMASVATLLFFPSVVAQTSKHSLTVGGMGTINAEFLEKRYLYTNFSVNPYFLYMATPRLGLGARISLSGQTGATRNFGIGGDVLARWYVFSPEKKTNLFLEGSIGKGYQWFRYIAFSQSGGPAPILSAQNHYHYARAALGMTHWFTRSVALELALSHRQPIDNSSRIRPITGSLRLEAGFSIWFNRGKP